MVAYDGHSIPSLERIKSQFTTAEPPRGGGGGRAKRSSIRRPQRSTACCRSIVNISCFRTDFKSLEGRRLRSKSLGGATLRTTTADPRRPLDLPSDFLAFMATLFRPRSPQEVPSSRQDAPRSPQDRPKIASRRPKIALRRPQSGPRATKSGQEGSWKDLGAILRHFGAILGSKMCGFPCVLQYFL